MPVFRHAFGSRAPFFAFFPRVIVSAFLALAVLSSQASAAGSGTAGDPFTTLADAYSVGSGRYHFNTGNGTFQADVDASEGGGWVLVLQYVHRLNTNPPLTVLGATADLPVTSSATPGADESADTARWGHAGNAAMSRFPGDLQLRWHGQTTASHGRVIHFRSSVGDDYVRTGTGDFAGIESSFVALSGHTANLPGAASHVLSDRGDYALTNSPYHVANAHYWGIRAADAGQPDTSGTRWEVDDFNTDHSTIHRVWVRNADADPLVVTSTADTDTPGTLRYAINYARGHRDDDAITFAIPGTGPHTIALAGGLPGFIDAGISIDGTTQSGASCGQLSAGVPHTLMIHIDGQGVADVGFTVFAPGATIKGLSLTNMASKGFFFRNGSDGGRIECNYWGVEPDGTTAGPLVQNNGIAGATQFDKSDNAVITNNLFAGNADDANDVGLVLTNLSGATVTGNVIGLAADAMTALPNGAQGIAVQNVSSVTFGGTTAATRNVISGNGDAGIWFSGTNTDVTLRGNLLGLARDGTTARGNGAQGVTISGTLTNATLDGNTISANTEWGMAMGPGASFSGLTVTDNRFGTDITGLQPRGNGLDGVHIHLDTGTSSGLAITGNTIAANGGNGITLQNVTGGTVQGNRIGVGADGTTAMGNNLGILVSGNSSGTLLGGTGTGEGNIVAHSATNGIVVRNSARSAILGNSIHSNGFNGIELGSGVSVNDAGDGDSGPNDLLNYPVIDAFRADGTTTVNYTVTLDVPGNGNGYRIEFFATGTPDPGGHGEGRTYLGAVDVAGPGTHSGSFTATAPVAIGTSVSATTTRKTSATTFDATSEFSVNATSRKTDPAQLAAAKTVAVVDDGLLNGDDTVAIPGATLRYTIVIRNDGEGAADAGTTVVTDRIPANGSLKVSDFGGMPGTGPVGVSEGSPGSGLTYSYSGLGSGTDDLEFSDDGGTTWTYAPADGGDGTDPAVTHIRIRPDGAFDPNTGTPPSISMRYEVVLF